MEFKKGMKVKYTTGVNSGTGTIIKINPTTKGNFYVVRDDSNRAVYALRGAKLTPV